MANLKDVLVPDIGDFKNIPVIEVLVKPGDKVSAEESLITLESDKATMEVPAPFDGVVKEMKIKVGDTVSEGTAILTIEALGAATSAAPEPKAAEPAPEQTPPKPVEEKISTTPPPVSKAPSAPAPSVSKPINEENFSAAHASPGVRRFARELGVDLGLVKGSGPKGRILREDVQSFVKSVMQTGGTAAASGSGLGFNLPAWPVIDFEKFGPTEKQALSRIKKISGPALHRNWITIPHITQHDEVDITDLEAFRKSLSKDA